MFKHGDMFRWTLKSGNYYDIYFIQDGFYLYYDGYEWDTGRATLENMNEKGKVSKIDAKWAKLRGFEPYDKIMLDKQAEVVYNKKYEG